VKLAPLVQTAIIAAAALLVYSFVTAAKDGEERRRCAHLCHLAPDYAARNRRAPDFELPSLDGRTRRLSDFRGQTVVLNFWTKTCRPCLEEMPSLGELAQVLARDGRARVVTITTDESVEDARATLASVLGAATPFVTLVDPGATVVGGKFGTKLYPETWIIDPNGIIRARFDGPRDWASPLAVQLARSFNTPLTCTIEFGPESGDEGAARCDRITG
jgi:peroxiredoxin